MRIVLILLSFWLFSFGSWAQSPADWWYFGQYAGVHFTTSGPVADTNGQVSTSEGVATIADNQGNLLFYTDGLTVYNKLHQVMPNGNGLLGNPSSTQSAVCVPRPGSTSEFYIFTMAVAASANGMRYTKVDLNLAGGLGDVVVSEKNVQLVTPCAEKLSVIQKPGGYWAVSLKIPGDTMYAYEVTSAGVNLTPVVSNTGVSLTTSTYWGYLKPSPDGTKLGFISQGINDVYVFDFNQSTGMVTNTTQITQTIGPTTGYGIEFSPDGNLLYAMSYGQCDVHQYDLTAGSAAAISATEIQVSPPSLTGGGALQLGPDGKLYVGRASKQYISVIEFPNVYGLGCGFIDTAVDLAGRTCVLGLPTFIQSFFNVSFQANDHCFGEPFQFSFDTAGVDSVFWNFGDPASGSQDSSYAYSPTHTFTDTGFFTVTLIAKSDTLIDTSTSILYVYPHQSIDLGPDTTLCTGTELLFSAAQPFASSMWHDSSVADTFLTSNDTLVWVTVNGVCDTVSDTVRIAYDDSVNIDLGPDSLICDGVGYTLVAGPDGLAEYVWNTGDTAGAILASSTDTFSVTGTNACGAFTDTVAIIIKTTPQWPLLPPDTLNCYDDEIVLARPQDEGTTYYWQDSTSKKTYTVDTTELVWLAAINECGTTIDSMELVFNGEIHSNLGEDTTICNTDSIVLNAFDQGATYFWNTGDTADSVVTYLEDYLYIVTVTRGACFIVESKRVDLDDFFCPDIDCRLNTANVFTPNGDGVNDKWEVWSDCDILKYDLSIYNRWGQLIHHSNNAGYGWDGTINGEPAPDGTYFYELQFSDQVIVDVDRLGFRGSLTLIRD